MSDYRKPTLKEFDDALDKLIDLLDSFPDPDDDNDEVNDGD